MFQGGGVKAGHPGDLTTKMSSTLNRQTSATLQDIEKRAMLSYSAVAILYNGSQFKVVECVVGAVCFF